jgi:hypothetical protein
LGTFISCPQSKARLGGHPSSRVAAAGNSAFKSDVVLKIIAAMSLISILLACVISTSSSSVAARILSLLFAETVVAPLMPRHCNLTSPLFRFKAIAYPIYHPSSRKRFKSLIINEYNLLTNSSGWTMLDVFKESRLAATNRRLGDGEPARRPTPGGYVFCVGEACNDTMQGRVERQTSCRAPPLSAMADRRRRRGRRTSREKGGKK